MSNKKYVNDIINSYGLEMCPENRIALKEIIKSFISQKLTEQKEKIIKWADENMADGDLTYERLLIFIKKL
jgi:hypothetical protein